MFSALSFGQTTVEYGTVTGGSSTAAAGTGNAIGGIFNKLKKAISEPTPSPVPAADSASSAPGKPSPAAPGKPATSVPAKDAVAAPGATPEVKLGTACAQDPNKVTVGLDYQTVLDRCGIPVTSTLDEDNVQTLLYSSKSKEIVIKIASKKVISVSASEKKQEAVEFVIVQ